AVIEPRGETLIAQRGGAGESGNTEGGSTGCETERAWRHLFVLHEAVAAENVHFFRLVTVDADVEGVAVEHALAGGDEIRRSARAASDVRQRNRLQQRLRLR